MMIFIRYRRVDTADVADRMYRFFASIYGDHNVFMDVCSIRLGMDFEKALCDALIGCDVFLPLIGRKWVGSKASRRIPRIQDPRDFVHMEVLSAMRWGVTIVPILIDDAEMPESDTFPMEIRAIRTMQGRRLQSTRMEMQVLTLAEEKSRGEFGDRKVAAFTVVEDELLKEIRAAGVTIAHLAGDASIGLDIMHQAINGSEIQPGTAKKIFNVVQQYRTGVMFLDIFKPVFRRR